jgi:hypothetical protein
MAFYREDKNTSVIFMNIQEAINYRTNCIICSKHMPIDFERMSSARKLKITETDKGIEIRSGHKNGIYMLFKPDGQVIKTEKNYKIYSSTIQFFRRCEYCRGTTGAPIILKSRSVGASTALGASSINNLRDSAVYYSFYTYPNKYGVYTTSFSYETIRYSDGTKFWHVNTSANEHKSIIYYGKFSDPISKAIYLTVPDMNLSNVKTKEQLIDKIKMYTLFS